MTQTIQSHSWVFVNDPGGDLTINQPEAAEDTISLLFSVLVSLNKLCEKLENLDYALKREKMK